MKRIDITGIRYNKLIVISDIGTNINGVYTVIVKCDCGTTKEVLKSHLKQGNIISCGCIIQSKHNGLVGTQVGFYTVLSKNDEYTYSRNKPMYNCQCRCGSTRIISGDELSSGRTTKCKNCMKGVNHPNWKGGNSTNNYGAFGSYGLSKIRSKVIKKLGNKCFKCNTPGNVNNKLNLHHIYSRHNNLELQLEVDNLVPLCTVCHKSFHNQYGKSNTVEQFQEFVDLKAKDVLVVVVK